MADADTDPASGQVNECPGFHSSKIPAQTPTPGYRYHHLAYGRPALQGSLLGERVKSAHSWRRPALVPSRVWPWVLGLGWAGLPSLSAAL